MIVHVTSYSHFYTRIPCYTSFHPHPDLSKEVEEAPDRMISQLACLLSADPIYRDLLRYCKPAK